MPPQLPSSRLKPSSSSSSSLSAGGGGKRPSLLAAVSSTTKKIARPTSAPILAALSASMTAAPAPKKIAARPVPPLARPPDAAGRRAAPPSSKIVPKKPACPASAGSSLAAHPTRRLTCGTAVYVRTRYVMMTGRCCLLIWLPARVVSASDAYHCSVKYAADLHAMFANKVVRVPVTDVREAPHRPAANAMADRSKKPEAP